MSISNYFADGSYDSILTGFGIFAQNTNRLLVSNSHFWNLGRSGIRLASCRGASIVGNSFSDNNRVDDSEPDVDVYGSTGTTVQGNSHERGVTPTNKGVAYREDAGSVDSFFDTATALGTLSNYASPLAVVNSADSLGTNNRPRASWPSGV